MIPQGTLCLRHHQCPKVFRLTAVKNGHHVGESLQIHKQHLPLGSGFFGHQLDHRWITIFVLGQKDSGKAPFSKLGADPPGPFQIDCGWCLSFFHDNLPELSSLW